MITMTNVLKRGRTVWDRDLLPEDEYVERVRAAREVMRAQGLDALVAVGHTTRYGNLTWLSGNVPPLGWMAVVLGLEGDPVLVTGGGSRDLPFLRTVTWIEAIRPSPSLFAGPAEGVSATLAAFLSPGAKVALVGAREELAPAAHGELLAALRDYAVIERDDLLAGLRAVKRPRELLALGRAYEIAHGAAEAALERFAEGGSNAAALLEGEHVARLHGCRDVRVLGNVAGPALAPVEGGDDERAGRLTIYCAVEYLGYWAQACACSARAGAAQRALRAMVEAAAPGVALSELAAGATAELPAGEDDVALAYGLGGAIGLDLDERPRVEAGSGDVLAEGAVLALQVITVEDGEPACAGTTLRVVAGGVAPL